MEDAKINKKRRLMRLMVFAWIVAATLGGCVVSLNIQKNNSNSEQKVDQNVVLIKRMTVQCLTLK